MASGYAAIITIVFVVIITVWAELSVPLKDWLKNFSGHHWTSKSILSALLYGLDVIILYLSPLTYDARRLKKTLGWLIAATALGTIILTLFFTAHHFKLF